MTPLPDPRLHLRVVAHSEVGLVRKNNQDSGYASPRLLVVADGMGGAAAGDLASAVAIDVIRELDRPELTNALAATDAAPVGDPTAEETDDSEPTVVVSPRDISDEAPDQGPAGLNPLLGRFADAIAEANSRIADLVAADYHLEGMGTTVTGALFDGARLGLAHIGDSRAYLLRDGHLEQLSHDHSWVQSLVDDGKISPEEAAYHPHRSLLLKVLNGQPANEPDLTTVELRAGDRVLFCSDGLSGMVDDDEIAELAAQGDLERAVTGLVEAALAAGGIDNITVILAEAVGGPESPAVRAGAGAEDDDDTAVRGAVGTTTVLGAAAEREIPAVPRRDRLVSGFDDDAGDGGDGDDGKDGDEAGPDGDAPGAPSGGTVDDESRYAPRPPAKRRLVRTLVVGLAVLLVTAAGLGAGYAWTRTQYFVGAADGQVAIYQGLPDGIPGVPLAQVYEVQDLPVASLPPYYQAQVATGIEVSSLDGARVTVEQLKAAAARCAQPPPTPSPTPRPTPTPTGTPTSTASATAKQSATTSALPGPTAPTTGAPTTKVPTQTPAPTPTVPPEQGC